MKRLNVGNDDNEVIKPAVAAPYSPWVCPCSEEMRYARGGDDGGSERFCLVEGVEYAGSSLLLLLSLSGRRHRARGKVRRGVSLCVVVWSGTPFLPPVKMCVGGSSSCAAVVGVECSGLESSINYIREKSMSLLPAAGRSCSSSSLARRKRRRCRHQRQRRPRRQWLFGKGCVLTQINAAPPIIASSFRTRTRCVRIHCTPICFGVPI